LKRFVVESDAFSQRRPDAAVFAKVGREGGREGGRKEGREEVLCTLMARLHDPSRFVAVL
jgi:hypothetical protein